MLCRWEHLSLGYTEPPGLPALREEISKAYTAINSDNIVVLAPEEGIVLTLSAILQPGDHVVVTYPGYQTLYEIARSIGCKVSYWQPRFLPDSSTWFFDIHELQQMVQPSTKVAYQLLPATKALDACRGPHHTLFNCVGSDCQLPAQSHRSASQQVRLA